METEQQRHWLHARGCDELQGYLLGRPMPFDDLLPLLQPGGRTAEPTVDTSAT